jgi:hypothetical protein
VIVTQLVTHGEPRRFTVNNSLTIARHDVRYFALTFKRHLQSEVVPALTLTLGVLALS